MAAILSQGSLNSSWAMCMTCRSAAVQVCFVRFEPDDMVVLIVMETWYGKGWMCFRFTVLFVARY